MFLNPKLYNGYSKIFQCNFVALESFGIRKTDFCKNPNQKEITQILNEESNKAKDRETGRFIPYESLKTTLPHPHE
jgi:hypothetical protein